MIKKQYLGEINLKKEEPIKPYIEEITKNCIAETGSSEIEIHQIVTVSPLRFLVVLNFYS